MNKGLEAIIRWIKYSIGGSIKLEFVDYVVNPLITSNFKVGIELEGVIWFNFQIKQNVRITHVQNIKITNCCFETLKDEINFNL